MEEEKQEKTVDIVVSEYEKQIKELKAEHEKEIKLLNDTHAQEIRSIMSGRKIPEEVGTKEKEENQEKDFYSTEIEKTKKLLKI